MKIESHPERGQQIEEFPDPAGLARDYVMPRDFIGRYGIKGLSPVTITDTCAEWRNDGAWNKE